MNCATWLTETEHT